MFCMNCGPGGRIYDLVGEKDPSSIFVSSKPCSDASHRSVSLRAVLAFGICAALLGAIFLMTGCAGNVGDAVLRGLDSDELAGEQVEPHPTGDASLVVYSSSGTEMSEYDVTLIGEGGETAAYHVDHAWGGFLVSSLGVEDGTYEVIVTDQHSGDSASVSGVVVSSQSSGVTTYKVGSEDGDTSEEDWSYMNTATNKLAAAKLFWKECQELQEEHGLPSTFTDTELGFVYPTGLCFANLLDVNEDGEDELVVCYIDQHILEENIANRSPYGSTIKDPGWIRVFRYNHQYRDLSSGLQTATGISAGMGAIGFTHDVPTGVGLVKCDLNRGSYVRYDLTGESFESKEYSNSGTYGYLRNGEEVGPTEAAQGIQDLLSHCTLYQLCGEIDPSIPAEVLPYSEVERVTAETLEYLSHADEILFKKPR